MNVNTKEPSGTMTAGEHQEGYQEPLTWLLPGLPWKDDQPPGPGLCGTKGEAFPGGRLKGRLSLSKVF